MNSVNTTAAAGTAGGSAFVASTAALAQTSALGPNSTGSPGPGPSGGGLPNFRELSTGSRETYESFGCKVAKADPPTPDWERASVWFDRKIASHSITMPDGKLIDLWVFQDERIGSKSRALPSPLMRVQQGSLVHVRFKSSKGPHTIHHHGVDASSFNDGVGHSSFEVGSEYIYQWEANNSGTFIYHCHVNTPLHFEMGLYGALIIDPPPNPDGKVPVFAGGPTYDVERLWVLDDIDPRWHLLDHGAGLCGEDIGLNIFEPKYFLITGSAARPGTPVARQRVTARPGQKILLRMVNASYSVVRAAIEGLEATIVCVDGHALKEGWNRPQPFGQNLAMKEISLPTAARYDVIIDLGSEANRRIATRGRSFRAEFEFLDWITNKRHNAGDPLYEGLVSTTIDIV